MPASVPGLRSPYDQVGGLVAFGRMLDKIRLHAVGQLPESYHSMLGDSRVQTLDSRCCRLLNVSYASVQEQVRAGLGDAAILDWALSHRKPLAPEEIEIWNAFLIKRGWRDETTAYLQKALVKDGFAPDAALTFFDHMDLDEGRPLRFAPDPAPPSEPVRGKNHVPGLRSPYEKVGGVYLFGRMLDKIRLSAAGKLPADWEAWRGDPKPITFDSRVCRFLGIRYADIEAETLRTKGTDEELLEWAFAKGHFPSEEELLIWNAFVSKLGWRDALTERVHFRLHEAGFPLGAALTSFDFIVLDEAGAA